MIFNISGIVMVEIVLRLQTIKEYYTFRLIRRNSVCVDEEIETERQAGRQVCSQAGRQAGRYAGRQAGRQVCRQAGRQVCRQAGRYAARQAGRQAGRYAGRQAGRHIHQDGLLCHILSIHHGSQN